MSEEVLAMGKRVVEVELKEVARLIERLDESFVAAVQLIKEAVDGRNKVVVVGVGKSGHIGEKIAATLTSTGAPAVILNSLNALHGDLGVVVDGDVVLALSYSGETEELNNILPALGKFNIKIIAMTGNPQSFLAKNSHVILCTGIEEEACPLHLAPTSSTTVMLVMGDALAMAVLQLRGFRAEDFAKFHPGGKLGRSLLLKVEHMMRGREEIAVVGRETLVRDVLKEMTQRRSGAAVVVDHEGKLVGIFTHGDFARYFQQDPGLGERPVQEYMTLRPVTIQQDKLAVEVLHVLKQHRIDDLVVLDAEERPVGVVDSQDLAKFKLL